jgi:hypothetical protein
MTFKIIELIIFFKLKGDILEFQSDSCKRGCNFEDKLRKVEKYRLFANKFKELEIMNIHNLPGKLNQDQTL